MCVKDFKMPKDVNVTPGTGLVDFPGLFKRLRQGGFREGSLIIECLDNVDGSQLISEAIQARKMLEELVA
jgi:sugar phosphate isomerase/epimerase